MVLLATYQAYIFRAESIQSAIITVKDNLDLEHGTSMQIHQINRYYKSHEAMELPFTLSFCYLFTLVTVASQPSYAPTIKAAEELYEIWSVTFFAV